MKTIEILIGPAGETTVQTRGYTGPSCQEASRFIEQALGERLAVRQTAEFFESESAVHTIHQQG